MATHEKELSVNIIDKLCNKFPNFYPVHHLYEINNLLGCLQKKENQIKIKTLSNIYNILTVWIRLFRLRSKHLKNFLSTWGSLLASFFSPATFSSSFISSKLSFLSIVLYIKIIYIFEFYFVKRWPKKVLSYFILWWRLFFCRI